MAKRKKIEFKPKDLPKKKKKPLTKEEKAAKRKEAFKRVAKALAEKEDKEPSKEGAKKKKSYANAFSDFKFLRKKRMRNPLANTEPTRGLFKDKRRLETPHISKSLEAVSQLAAPFGPGLRGSRINYQSAAQRRGRDSTIRQTRYFTPGIDFVSSPFPTLGQRK